MKNLKITVIRTKPWLSIGVMKVLLLIASVWTFMLFYACSENRRSSAEPAPEAVNGVYYWKTVFNLSSQESEFLEKHDIQRIYLRMFDVDYGMDHDGKEKSLPIASLRFDTLFPHNIEAVPVVYITTEAISRDGSFDSLMYVRIQAMAQRNGMGKIKEIQLDCDWTQSTQASFFNFCKRVRERCHADSIRLSATIRLHQLTEAVPPVDKGVLMLYNTGSLYNYESKNSILDDDDVAPYIRGDLQYGLPLSLAFPTYQWGLLFRNEKFVSILHQTDFTDTERYEQQTDGRYRVVKNHYVENKELRKGDIIRLEKSDPVEILKVKQRIETAIEGGSAGNILYHLDAHNLSKYTDVDIDKILK